MLRGWISSRRWGRLAGDTVWASSVEVLTLVSSLVVMYLITTRLGPADYGYFVGVQALVATLGMLSYVSLTQLLMQRIVRDQSSPQDAFSSALTLLVGGALLTLGLGFLLRLLLLPNLYVLIFLLLAVAELVGAGVVALSASYLQALDRYRQSVIARLSLLLFRTMAVVILAALGGLSLEMVGWTYFTLGLVVALSVLVHLRVRCGLSVRLGKPSRRDVLESLSFAGTLLSFSVHEDADKMLMVRLADPATAGLYAAAYRAVQVAIAPLRALVAASHRRFLLHDPGRTGEHVHRTRRYTLVGVAYALPAALIVLAAAPLIPELLGSSYVESVAMVQVLAIIVLFRGLGLFSFNGLMGLRAHGVRLLAIGSAGLVAAVLCVLLIPPYGWVGGAIATIASEVVFTAMCWGGLVHLQRRHDVRVVRGRAKVPAGGHREVPADGQVKVPVPRSSCRS